MILIYTIIGVVFLNILAWGIVRLHREHTVLINEIIKKTERISENNRQILEMLK